MSDVSSKGWSVEGGGGEEARRGGGEEGRRGGGEEGKRGGGLEVHINTCLRQNQVWYSYAIRNYLPSPCCILLIKFTIIPPSFLKYLSHFCKIYL